MLHLLGIGCFLFYLASSIGFISTVVRKRKQVDQWPLKLLFFGFILHSLVLILLLTGKTPFSLRDQGDYFLWVSWFLPLACFLLRSKLDSPLVGTFIAPVTSLLFACSSLLLHFKPKVQPLATDYLLFGFHIFPALIAEASLAFAFIVSLIFLVQHKRLKQKSTEALRIKGPNLELLESLNHYAVLVGFFSITFAIISGIMRALTAHNFVVSQDFLTWLSLASWMLLLLILYCRVNAKWSARRLSLVTAWVTGLFFILVVVSLVVKGSALHGGIYS